MSTIDKTETPACMERFYREMEKKLDNAEGCIRYARLAEIARDRFDIIISVEYCYIWEAVLLSARIDHWRDVTPVAKFFAQNGMKLRDKPIEVGSALVWFLTERNRPKCRENDSFDIRLTAYLSDSGSCRRVKVGEKTVVQPVYEIQCSDSHEALPDEAAMGELVAATD